MSHSGEVGAYHTRPHWYWKLVAVLAAITIFFGGKGYWDYDRDLFQRAQDQDAMVAAFKQTQATNQTVVAPKTVVTKPTAKSKSLWEREVGWIYRIGDRVGATVHRIWQSGYEALQLFILHTPPFDRMPNLWLEIGRFSGFCVFGMSLAGALWQVGLMEIRHHWYGWDRGHVVICGAGWRGVALARGFNSGDLKAKPNWKGRADIVVLERNADAPGLQECDRLKIPYIIGDATDPKVLREAGIRRAREMIAVCGIDEVNLEIVIRAQELGRPKSLEPLKCHVHLSDDDLRSMVRQKGITQATKGPIEISTFGTDINENTARNLLAYNPLDRVPIDPNSPLRAHLLIIGFGPMGQAILKEAACIAQFANNLKLRVTIVDPRASQNLIDFTNRYKETWRVADIDKADLVPHDGALVDLVAKAAEEPNFLPTCVVCFPDEKLNLSIAVKLGDALKSHSMPIRWWLQSRSDAGLGLVFSEHWHDERAGNNVRFFGTMEQVCNAESLEREDSERMGRAMHEHYVAEQQDKGETLKSNATLQSWDMLPESIKNSNRLAADHIAVKLRAIGYHLDEKPAKSDPVMEFNDDQIDLLSRMEHARYCAERFMDGWKPPEKDPTTGKPTPPTKDFVKKTNPTLIKWGELDLTEQKKDRDQVSKIPQIVDKAGFYISR